MAKSWPVSKPPNAILGLTVERLNAEFQQLELKRTLSHQAHRFQFELEQPSQLLVKVTSTIAATRGWHRAGYLAHILRGTPISDPVADVQRLYFGQQYIAFPWTGLGYCLEFWPHVWISDYQIEVWARETPAPAATTQIEQATGLLLFGTGQENPAPFTFFGVPILFP